MSRSDAGKGDDDTRTESFAKRRDNHEVIFGKKDFTEFQKEKTDHTNPEVEPSAIEIRRSMYK